MKITRCILRTAVLGGVALGAGAILFPHHTSAGLDQIKTTVSSVMNEVIDDPVIMRQRLQALADELPEQIAELQGELSLVDQQIAQLSRDTEVAHGVVAMTTQDLTKLQDVITRADNARSAGEMVRVRFDGRGMDVRDAKAEFKRINQIRQTYDDRLAANKRDLKYLETQRSRLTDLLAELETEYATIESQMWQIDRKIDAIARNEKLVEELEDRERAFDAYASKFDINSLNELQSKLAQWETEIDARFERIDQRDSYGDYEKAVLWELESRDNLDDSNDFEIEESDYRTIEPSDDPESIVLGPRIIE